MKAILFIVLIYTVASLTSACSTIGFREGYRLQSDKLEKPLVNSCNGINKRTEAATFVVPGNGDIKIFTRYRTRSEFFGPIFVPLIPLRFNSQEEVTIALALDFENNATKLKTDFRLWMISNDGVSWVPAKSFYVPHESPKDNSPSIYEVGNVHYVATYSASIVFPLKTQDTSVLYLKTGPMTFEGKTIKPTVIVWNRERYTEYTPFWGLPHTGPKTTPNCP